MRQFASMLIPPLVVLVAVAIFGSARVDTLPTPVREPEATEAARADTGAFCAPPTKSPVTAAVESAGAGMPEASETLDAENASARALVFSLGFAAESSSAGFPTLEVTEAARLLTRHPETAEVFVEALSGASRELRAILLHTFYRVEDGVLKEHLLQVHHETDPTAARLSRILADRDLILATLLGHTDQDLRSDLLGRLGPPLLTDPDIRAALLGLARESEDPKLRNRALERIGRTGDPEVRQLLLATLADPLRDIGERQTAARILMHQPGPDTTPLFVTIIRRNEAASLLRFSALGLKTAGAEPEAMQALFDLLLAEGADEIARRNAATALSHTVRIAPEGTSLLLQERLRSALCDLSHQKTSGAVLVHAMGEVSRGHEGRFDEDLAGILRSYEGEQYRGLLVADPTLKRLMEEL